MKADTIIVLCWQLVSAPIECNKIQFKLVSAGWWLIVKVQNFLWQLIAVRFYGIVKSNCLKSSDY